MEKGGKTKTVKDDLIIITEEEKMPFFSEVGAIVGDNAMREEGQVRMLSGMAKIDSIFLLLNHDAFDILVKEKQKKDFETLTNFIFDSIPRFREHFQFRKIVKIVGNIFHEEKYIRNKEIIREGERSEKMYIIMSGLCAMYRKIEVKDILGMPKIKQEKILNIEAGGIIGEEGLLFDSDNSYTIKAITPVVLRAITNVNMKTNFRRALPNIAEFFRKRALHIEDRYDHLKKARNYERKHFNSKIEKGSMNVFLQKDFKNQVDFADNKTKRKL